MAIILSNQWLAKRRPYWDRLATLLGQAGAPADRFSSVGWKATGAGVRQLSRAELRETALLYRQVASDLSTLRQDSTARVHAEHVNQLLARAHHIIYSSRRKGFLKILYFLRDEYPALVQRQIRYVLLSLVVMVSGALLGSVLTLARPQFMRHMLGPAMVETIERHEMWTHSLVSVAPAASSAIMTNNISVCFIAFAGGIVFGLGPLWSMFFNGLLLGVIGVACQQHGMSLDLWSFVAPHGSLELPSIILAGAAGLRLGRGVMFPGALPPPRLHRPGRRRSYAPRRRRHSAAGHRRHPRRILFALRRARLAQIHRRRIAVHAAARLAVPPGEGSESPLPPLPRAVILRTLSVAMGTKDLRLLFSFPYGRALVDNRQAHTRTSPG